LEDKCITSVTFLFFGQTRSENSDMSSHIGLVLSGGGARTAFQVGVLKAIRDWVNTDHVPFTVITGSSAGSINAAYLAANADQFSHAVNHLATMWGGLTTRDIFTSDVLSITHTKTLLNVFNHFRKGLTDLNSILNALPLAKLLHNQINFDRIQYCLDQKILHSLAISTTNFQHSMSTTFVQSNQNIHWERVRRIGVQEKIKVKHLMASTAIPFLFSPVKINNQFYGDGSLRNFAPLSSAIRCGATSLIVIGIRELDNPTVIEKDRISFGDIFSKILNTILFDSIDIDFERLNRINDTIQNNPNGKKLKNISSIIIRPTIDFQHLVEEYDYECPKILRQLLKLIGSKTNGADLKSYLMFESGYLNALIDQGYRDAHHQKDAILSKLLP
jgi:NTE family protein